MTMTRAFRCVLVLAVSTLGMTAVAGAQTNDEVPYPQLQWNFSTPGARANGMGRSFIGLADDATAVITNPAGLMNLTRPQVYVEYKNTKLQTDRLAAADSLFTLQPTTFESTINSLSFLSVSVPINARLAAGFSVHRFLDYHELSSLATRRIPNLTTFFFPIVGTADFTATSYGGSVAFMATQQLRIGLTVAGNSLKADSDWKRFDFVGSAASGFTQSDILANEVSTHDSQRAVSASLGILYRINDMVSAGFNYERSPRFNTTVNLQTNPGFRNAGGATNQPLVTSSGFPKSLAFNVPDHFGVGVSVRPHSKLLIAADAVRINYSSLTKNTTIVFNASVLTGSEYVTPDVTEIHAGAEYNVYNMKGNLLFLRAGVFTNPNHQPTFSISSDANVNASQTALFNLLPGKNETRGTIGGGIALGPHAQVDAAYVFGREFVLSTGVRF